MFIAFGMNRSGQAATIEQVFDLAHTNNFDPRCHQPIQGRFPWRWHGPILAVIGPSITPQLALKGSGNHAPHVDLV